MRSTSKPVAKITASKCSSPCGVDTLTPASSAWTAVQGKQAVVTSRKRGPLRLVDAWQERPTCEEHHLSDACFQGGPGIVECRGAGAQYAHLFAPQRGEIDVVRGVEHSAAS